jgi:serine/threonine-protein kinase
VALAAEPSPVAFDWVTIPAGEFLMGSDKGKDDQARSVETPQHKLVLPEFRIARVPVTNAQYHLFVKATGQAAPDQWSGGRIPDGKENHPVVHVSWLDVQAFCRWANVRLPTEAEWEKAARGTDGLIWPWREEAPDNKRRYFNNSVGDTTPVGAYPDGASPYGVLDMAGNVWEWTSSQYKPYPYDAKDGREDLAGGDPRTLRGGSFYVNVKNVRCAARSDYYPSFRYDDVGFRVVRHETAKEN